jgi:hypothetical protein
VAAPTNRGRSSPDDAHALDATRQLSWTEKLVRYYYQAVETLLDRSLIEYVLVESYETFREAGEPYPFVQMSELRPGGVGPVEEYPAHNAVLLLLLERALSPELKTNIRARRPQEAVKRNLGRYLFRRGLPVEKVSLVRDLESRANVDALRPLLSLDYGLLIQQRAAGARGRLNYALTHFHVKIDEVFDRVIESLGLRLRYLSRSLFEQGEDYAARLEEKLFELYGMKSTAAGRRTAALVAHNLLVDNPGLHAVYVGSTESRGLFKIQKSDKVTRSVLVEMDDEQLEDLLDRHELTPEELLESYVIPETDPPVGVLTVHYYPTVHGSPPADRKLRREIHTQERWTSVGRQLLMPLPSAPDARPLEVSWVYKAKG